MRGKNQIRTNNTRVTCSSHPAKSIQVSQVLVASRLLDVQPSQFTQKKNAVHSSLIVQNGQYGSNNEGSQIRNNAPGKMNVESTSGSNPPNRRGEVDFTP